MCRNIKNLRYVPGGATEEDCELAALQYIRKVSGFRKPSKANEAVFQEAVNQVAESTRLLLETLVVRSRLSADARPVGDPQSFHCELPD